MHAVVKKLYIFLSSCLLLNCLGKDLPVFADNWEARVYDTALPSRLIAVDKSQQSFMFFEKKSPFTLKLSYPCSTGQSSGDKLVLGDRRTPEGVYFVEYKIANGLDFKEYGGIAYTLNYPNPVDKLRGKSGYGIWIHSKGQDIVPKDTRGCVAIDLKNLEQVGPQMAAGTAVMLAERIPSDSFLVRDPGVARKLRERMHLWTQAWANRSNDLFDFYNQDSYTKAMPETFAAFKNNKERLFRMLPWISIYNREIFVLEGPGYWVTWSEQFYRAPNLSTEGIRRLYWQQEKDGQFKIVGMEWTPRDVGLRAEFLKGTLVASATPGALPGPERPRSAVMSEIPAPPPISMPEDAPPNVPGPAPMPQNIVAEAAPQKIMPPAVLPKETAAPSLPTPAQDKTPTPKVAVAPQPKAEVLPAKALNKPEEGFLARIGAFIAKAEAMFDSSKSRSTVSDAGSSVAPAASSSVTPAVPVTPVVSASPSASRPAAEAATQAKPSATQAEAGVPAATLSSAALTAASSTVAPVKEEAKKSELILDAQGKVQLQKLMSDWSAAWEKRSPAFFDFYDQAAYGKLKKGESFKALKADMERRFRSAPWIQIVSRAVTVEAVPGQNYAITSCAQYVRYPGQAATQGLRKLYWQKAADGRFRIIASEWVAEELGMQADYLEKIAPAISGFIESWRKVWERGDLSAYEGFYSTNARQGARQGLAGIIEHKRVIWGKAAPKDVELSGTRIQLDSKGVRVDMNQIYRDSLGFQDKGLKSVLLEPDGASWKISVEDWSALPGL